MAQIRLVYGGISHESVTYVPERVPLSAFRIRRGLAVPAAFANTRSYIGGMLDGAARHGIEASPLLMAHGGTAGAGGSVTHDAYTQLLQELIDCLRAEAPFDAVALELHGAGVVERIGDMELDICRAVRAQIGATAKLLVVLDHHGTNVTKELLEVTDIVLGCREFPHVDMYDRGLELVDILPALIAGEIVPQGHVETIPMLLPSSTTFEGPAARANQVCERLEKEPGVIDCTIFFGLVQTDTVNTGVHVVAYADGNRPLAERTATSAASWVWAHREEFLQQLFEPTDAIARALEVAGGPVILNDFGDNPGCGAPGDGTDLLGPMLEANLASSCFGCICDPDVVKVAAAAGVGAEITVLLGGKYETSQSEPLSVTAHVKCITDGRVRLESRMGAGMELDLGPTARLRIGEVDVIVSSNAEQTFDPQVFLLHGIDVARYKIVGLKSEHHFRAGFSSLARAIFPVDTPGLSSMHFEELRREATPRPIWPLDASATYPASLSGHTEQQSRESASDRLAR